MYANLDFVAFDNYPGFFEMLLHEQANGGPVSMDAISATTAMAHDFGRSLKGGKPFMIMEEQSGKAGQRSFSPQPEKGQVRLWTYQAIAHGAMGVNYFRWDTATFGAEEYWHGVLNHDRSKSPAFDEIRQTVRELKTLGPEVLHSAYQAETALVFDYDCDWAVQIQPGHHGLRYMQQVTTWYGAIDASHTGIDVVVTGAELTAYKVVMAPLAYVLSEAQAARIREFVRNGGVFVSNFRLGVKTESGQIVRTPLPGLLRDVMGVTIEDYVPIYSAKQGVKFSQALAGADGECGLWADILNPSGAEVLATYTMGEHAGSAAITRNSFGKGKAIYIGPDLDGASLARVLRSFCAAAGVSQALEVPSGVEVTVREAGAKKFVFLLNHTPGPQSVKLSGSFTDMFTGESQAGTIELKAHDVRVMRAA
jgi:beta-galactosidase